MILLEDEDDLKKLITKKRDDLHRLIDKKEYDKAVKVSQELDILINEFMQIQSKKKKIAVFSLLFF